MTHPISRVWVNAAVEGVVDEAVARRLLTEAGAEVMAIHGKKGKSHLVDRMRNYSHAAKHGPWIILVDLDEETPCPSPAVTEWLTHRHDRLCLRIAVRAVESWLLADRRAAAQFLGVPVGKIPTQPEQEARPKDLVVPLAAESRSRAIREALVPSRGSGRAIGREYNPMLSRFVHDYWDPVEAATRSESLRRARTCVSLLVDAEGSKRPRPRSDGA